MSRRVVGSPIVRFWSKFHRLPNGCWEWIATTTRDGYPMMTGERHGTTLHVHRWIYETLVEPIPSGLEIDHLCRNTRCVNPAHLEPVTQAENMRRRYASVTHCKNGHPFDSANTYLRPSGFRDCRTCGAERQRRSRQRKRGAA